MTHPLRRVLTLGITLAMAGSISAQSDRSARPAASSADTGPMARYQDDGTTKVVTRDDLALDLARRHGRRDEGQRALEYLVHLTLVRDAAAQAGVMPRPTETKKWLEALDQKLKQNGMRLDALIRQKGMSREVFEREFAALQLAHERLVRRALDLAEGTPVSESQLGLWLTEMKNKRGVVTDPARLPDGMVAKIGTTLVTELQLGRIMERSCSVDERKSTIRQLVLKRLLDSEAKRMGIELTDADLDAEVERRRRLAQRNPKFARIGFESLLQAQGMTLASFRASSVLRAHTLERKIAKAKWSDPSLDARIDAEPKKLEREHGARRSLSVLFVRGSDAASGSGARFRRSKADARTQTERIAKKIADGLPFAEAAKDHSEDQYTRTRGGDCGWRQRVDPDVPEPVLDWAFSVGAGAVSEPLEVERGFYLARVDAIENRPSRAVMRHRLREALRRDFRRELIQSAKIEF